MSGLSRRTFLGASAGVLAAGAAVAAVPLTHASHHSSEDNSGTPAANASKQSALPDSADAGSLAAGNEPVMLHIRDAKRGEVAMLSGTNEVVFTDRNLVSQILRAGAQAGK
jgi:hypothetical protein